MVTSSTSIGMDRAIEFPSGHLRLRGRLRLPAGAGPFPLVILGAGLAGLKEFHNIPDVADALLAAGIGALTFDYRCFGDSDGEPRGEVDHTGQIEDLQSAISYAWTLQEVKSDRIGLWGTSLGGRNVLAVAALDHRVACVVAQVPMITFNPMLGAFMTNGGDVPAFLRTIAEDRRDRALGLEPKWVGERPDGEPTPELAAYLATFDEWKATLSAEARRLYGDGPKMTHRTFEPNIALDVAPLIPRIAPTPLLMIVADQDFLPGGEQAFDSAGEPKKLLHLEGHHYSVYSRWNHLAVNAARDWFATHLR